jgi:hypothetical protein
VAGNVEPRRSMTSDCRAASRGWSRRSTYATYSEIMEGRLRHVGSRSRRRSAQGAGVCRSAVDGAQRHRASATR